jgi:thioredoxin reductase (NADPH)
MYDSIIIGGGPAGLSAAIYLSRFNRKVLVLDKAYGRSSYHQVNENYLGFPEGIHAQKLRELGKKQAERFGTEFFTDVVEEIIKKDEIFVLRSNKKIFKSRTIILATGVTDKFPLFDNYDECVGTSLFWCITCDGYKTKGKNVIIVGRDDEAAITAMQFLNYTKNLVFLTNCDKKQVSIQKKYLDRLKRAKIPVFYSCIITAETSKGKIKKIILDSGQELESDFMFSMQGAVPNSYLAKQIGVELNDAGYIKIGLEQRTNVSRCYAAGDVTNHFSHQIATAVHEGSMAGQAANYDLYTPEQRD